MPSFKFKYWPRIFLLLVPSSLLLSLFIVPVILPKKTRQSKLRPSKKWVFACRSFKLQMLASKNQHKTSYQSQSPKNSAIKMYVFINHESQGSDTARETFTSIVPATVKTCFLLESLLFATISCKMGMLGWQIIIQMRQSKSQKNSS